MTPEKKEAMMGAWFTWKEKHGDAVLDLGAPMGAQHVVNPDGSSAEVHDDVTGYSMVEAADMDAAKAMLADHPYFASGEGCTVSVYQAHEM